MTEKLYEVEGKTGVLEIHPARIVIRRDGVLSRMQHGSGEHREIRMDQIAGINLDRGKIEFDVIGSEDEDDGVVQNNSHDEILFKVLSHDHEAWEQAVELIRERQQKLSEASEGGEGQSSRDEQTPKEILDRRLALGEIDEEEYRRKLDILNE